MAKKIKIDAVLYERAKKVAETEGYSSLDEFVIYIIEKEISNLVNSSADQEAVNDQLRGLGYIE